MSSKTIGFAPDPVVLVHRHVLRLVPAEDADMVCAHFLPDGYNTHSDGMMIVVAEDASQEVETSHSRDLVRVSVYGPDYGQIRSVGRHLWASLTQGVSGIGLGVSLSDSAFFGAGPSYKPTGFVATMSISVGLSKVFRTIGTF